MTLLEFSSEASALRVAFAEISRLVELAKDPTISVAESVELQRKSARQCLRKIDPIIDKFTDRHVDMGDGDSVDVLMYATAIGSSKGSGVLRIATVFIDALERHLERLSSREKSDDLETLPAERFVFSQVRWGNVSSLQNEHSAPKGSVFLVHGHNELVLQETARFLEKLGLLVVVLRELPNSGRSIIEKFVEHSNVEYAVVLLTGDDYGRSGKGNENKLNPRARQNVVFELGFFIGKLGRDKVCTLYEPDVEIPSDYSGVLFTKIDSAGFWRLELARELKAAGLSIDLNAI